MPMTRTIIHKNISLVEGQVKSRQSFLTSQKVDGKAADSDPFLRHLQSELRKFRRRLRALEKVETINQEVKSRKSGG